MWNTQRQASASIHLAHNVQDRTEIPMSTAAMRISWWSLVWSEGLYALVMGTCPSRNALFKNTHSLQASGDTFCYSVRSSKCNLAEEETFLWADGAEPEEGRVDKWETERCAAQESCVRGKLKVNARISQNLPCEPVLVTLHTHTPFRNKQWDADEPQPPQSTPRPLFASATLCFPSWGRREMKFNNKSHDDANYVMRSGRSVWELTRTSGRKIVWPVLWRQPGYEGLCCQAALWVYIKSNTKPSSASVVSFSRSLLSRSPSRSGSNHPSRCSFPFLSPPFLALNSWSLTGTLLHVHTSRRSLPLPRPQETHLDI